MFFESKEFVSPCGLFTQGHFVLALLTFLYILVMYTYTRNYTKEQVTELIKKFAVIFTVLEILKIVFSLRDNDISDVNTYLPLYFCSGFVFSLILSSCGKGIWKKVGEIYLATGAIVGGIIFLIFPTTSLATYPPLHFVSVHSFLYHGSMIYVSMLVNKTKYVEYTLSDLKYYSVLIFTMCLIAFGINQKFDSNLMFLSQNFDNPVINFMYTNFRNIFPLIMCLGQCTLPFLACYFLNTHIRNMKKELGNVEIVVNT